MTTTTDHIEEQRSIVGEDTMRAATREGRKPRAPRLTSEEIWREVAKRSFTVLSYVTPEGEPRSSGVVYKTVGRRLYVAVAPDSWKARHIATGAGSP